MAKNITKNKPRNFVQQHSLQINRAATFTDRKKASRKGYAKHRTAMCD